MSYQLPYFQERIDINQLNSYYGGFIDKEDGGISIDLNFKVSQTALSALDIIKLFLENIERYEQQNMSFINADFKSGDEGYVKEYLSYHLEEFKDDLEDVSEKELLDRMKLERIGIYPNSNNEFAICDYSVGLSDNLLVVYLNKNGELISIEMES